MELLEEDGLILFKLYLYVYLKFFYRFVINNEVHNFNILNIK
jgi:hypothetical protein